MARHLRYARGAESHPPHSEWLAQRKGASSHVPMSVAGTPLGHLLSFPVLGAVGA